MENYKKAIKNRCCKQFSYRRKYPYENKDPDKVSSTYVKLFTF